MKRSECTICLLPLQAEHAEVFHEWISDREAVEYSLSIFQKNRDLRWVSGYIDSIVSDKSSWNMVIYCNGIPIGYAGLVNVSLHNRSAEYFILIGNKSFWNRGIGTNVGVQVVNHAFSAMKLHRISLTVSDCNIAAIRSYQKIGFIVEGRMRDACLRQGKYHDKVIMAILEQQWHNKALHPTAGNASV